FLEGPGDARPLPGMGPGRNRNSADPAIEEKPVAKSQSSGADLTGEEFKAVCEGLLLAVPGPGEAPLSVTDFADRLLSGHAASSRRLARAACATLATLFGQLGLLDRIQPDLIRAVSDDASTFLHSLGQYLKAGLLLLGNWQARGPTPEARR